MKMKKLKVITLSAALSITSLGLLPLEKAEASVLNKSESVLEASTLDTLTLDTLVLNESDEIISGQSVTGSGWQTMGGIKARVSTSKDTYSNGENVVVKAERSGTGPTVYYRVDIYKREGSNWHKTSDSGKTGTFTSKVHNVTLKTYGSGIYKVFLKVWKDSDEEYWIGDWETTFASN